MFNRIQFRKEIEWQLNNISEEKRVAFAVRLAMRVLPVLAKSKSKNRKAFWFWKKKDKNEYLLRVLDSYICNFSIILRDRYITSYINTYEAYTNSTKTSVVMAVVSAAQVEDNTVNSIDAAVYASNTAYCIIEEIKNDLTLINQLTAKELLQRHLWSQTIPDDWQQLLKDFKEDVLSLNAGFDVWLDWYDDRLQGKPIDIELLKKWIFIPPEIQQQGVIVINAYLKNLVQKTAIKPLNRVRAIFIGYGEAGKTSLIRVLNNETVIEGKEDMTAGIAIRYWQIPNTDIEAHFWDFGGQVMAHATHQFFLRASCLYILVLNARSEINSTEQAEYWLEHIKSFAGDAPVLIVGNKADNKIALNLDMGYLKEKYPNIIKDYSLSCTQAQTDFKIEFELFKRDFCKYLQQVGTHQMLFTAQQFAVLQALRTYPAQQAFLKHDEFITLCQQNNIEKEGVQNREWLLDIFDKLGVVIHFKNLAYLDDYVLNPRWLTHGVYTLMYHKTAQLNERDVVDILRDKPIFDEHGNQLNYPADKCRFIMDAMREFKLCYPLPCDYKTLIIPELLPSDQPSNIPFDRSDALAFEFVFRGFLPRHIMPELIVNRHEEIASINKQQIVWQRGVLLKHKTYQAHALLRVDYHEKVLSILVKGSDAKGYLSILNDEVLKILARLILDYEERVELPVSACIEQKLGIFEVEKVDYRQLLNSVKSGIYIFPTKHNIYDLRKVLGIIMPEIELSKLGIHIDKIISHIGDKTVSNITQNITNSTVHGSVIAAEKVENCFNTLKQSKANNELKSLLEQLVIELKALNEKVPATQGQQLVDMSEELETLINETNRPTPRKKWYQASLEGIKDAALAVGEIAQPIIAIAEKLSPLLLA